MIRNLGIVDVTQLGQAEGECIPIYLTEIIGNRSTEIKKVDRALCGALSTVNLSKAPLAKTPIIPNYCSFQQTVLTAAQLLVQESDS